MSSDRFRSRWVWVFGVAVLLLGTTVAVGVWEANVEEDGPAFETNVSEARGSLAAMTGVRRTVIERDDETVTSVERVTRRPGTGQYRIETLSGDEAGSELEVSDGRTLWLSDVDEERTVRIDLGNASQPKRTDRIERLLTIVDGNDGPARSDGISPLPVVPSDGDQASSTAGVAGSLSVRYEGTTTVADRSTHVFELTSNANTSAFVSEFTQTIWLDRERYVPLKRVTAYRRADRNVSITVGYENVTFNPDVSAGTFQFDPPANATVVDADRPRQTHFTDRAGLRAASSFSVPEPSLPDAFELVEATRTVDDRVRSIGLRYGNETATVSISKSNLTDFEPRSSGETVTVGDHDATLRNLGRELRVSWTCGDARYSVAGSGVSRDQLVAIADSIACE